VVAKIAFLIPNLAGGGAERVAVTLVGALADRGHDVDLLVMEKGGELTDQVHPAVRLIDLKTARTRNVIWPLVRYLRRRRPDVLQVSMWPLTIVGIVAAKLSGGRVRCIVSDHAVLSDHYGRSSHRAIAGSVRLLYPLADARVGVSAGAAEDLGRLSGLPASAFTIIPNPIAFPDHVDRNAEIESLWGECAKRILTVGQLKPEKDHALLIRAFAQLRPALGAKLIIAGEGPLRLELSALAEREGVAERVSFPGYVADPWPLYMSADLFALSSREESFGNVLVEALYAGLPIVSTDTTGARSVLEGGRWGRLVPKGDASAFGAALREALDRPREIEPRRRRALELSGQSAVDDYERLLVGPPAA
jgi:glycosyltransferase involved in cell wall biosynthesis